MKGDDLNLSSSFNSFSFPTNTTRVCVLVAYLQYTIIYNFIILIYGLCCNLFWLIMIMRNGKCQTCQVCEID